MATLWRQGHGIESVKSLLSQPEFGTMTITCNKWTDEQFNIINETFEGDKRITLHRHNNEKGSNEKLRYIVIGENYYVSLLDDDLIYPSDYFAYMIQGCERHNAFVSLHGSVLKRGLIQSYYRDRKVYPVMGTVDNDIEVDIASNCGSLFRRDFFPVGYIGEWYDLTGKVSMDDIWVNYFCREFNIHRWVLAHEQGYLKHKTHYPEDDYVYDRYINNDGVQTNFINNIFWE
jgi:hypothetical protein